MASALHRCLCRAIVLTSANNVFKFQEDGAGPTRTATIAAGTYYLNGTGGADDVITALAAAMTTGSGVGATYTVDAYSALSLGVIFWGIVTDSTSVTYIESATTFPVAMIGIDSSLDASFAASLNPSNASPCEGAWTADVISSVQDPAGYMGGSSYVHTRPDGSHVAGRTAVPHKTWPCRWEFVNKRRVWQRHETSVYDWSWEAFWLAVNAGERMQLTEFVNVSTGQVATTTVVSEGTLAPDSRREIGITRDSDVPTFSIEATFYEDATA